MRISEALNIGVDHGTIERISFDGEISVDETVMVYVGERRIAKRSLLLGVALVICHILDGILTFFGMELFGIGAEGNSFLRYFMESYGHATTLFLAKSIAIILTVGLMLVSHQRRWVRHLLAFAIFVYLLMAVIPWVFILSQYQASL